MRKTPHTRLLEIVLNETEKEWADKCFLLKLRFLSFFIQPSFQSIRIRLLPNWRNVGALVAGWWFVWSVDRRSRSTEWAVVTQRAKKETIASKKVPTKLSMADFGNRLSVFRTKESVEGVQSEQRKEGVFKQKKTNNRGRDKTKDKRKGRH